MLIRHRAKKRRRHSSWHPRVDGLAPFNHIWCMENVLSCEIAHTIVFYMDAMEVTHSMMMASVPVVVVSLVI